MPTEFNAGVEWAYGYVTSIANGMEVQLEDKLTYTRKGDILYFGYADVICGDHIFDYKESSEGDYRPQLNGYAASYMQSTFKEEVTCHVMYGQTQRVDTWTIGAEEADEYVAEMFKLIEAPDKKPEANEYCKWCKHISSCDGVNELMVKAVEGGLMCNFDSPERLAEAKKVLPVFKAWVEGVDKLTKSTLEGGGDIPGFKLSRRRGRQFVSRDFFTAVAEEVAKRNFSVLDVLSKCSIAVPKAKDIYKEITGEDLSEDFLPRGKEFSVVVADKTKKIK
jgi:hypothetical protein